ncbi:hypothetical protein ACP6PL_08150 [Dapis sp. BLCC M126]|uniref:hypothetical protein n=1 Tax=Dapis sp. BLCC M126 TaxID=3400189 RepID=UPI003CF40118
MGNKQQGNKNIIKKRKKCLTSYELFLWNATQTEFSWSAKNSRITVPHYRAKKLVVRFLWGFVDAERLLFSLIIHLENADC